MIDPEYIWILIFSIGGVLGREIWLHATIARQANDIRWIKKCLEKMNSKQEE